MTWIHSDLVHLKSEIKHWKSMQNYSLFCNMQFCLYTHQSTHPDPVYIKLVLFSPFCHLWLCSYHSSCMDYPEFLQVGIFFESLLFGSSSLCKPTHLWAPSLQCVEVLGADKSIVEMRWACRLEANPLENGRRINSPISLHSSHLSKQLKGSGYRIRFLLNVKTAIFILNPVMPSCHST